MPQNFDQIAEAAKDQMLNMTAIAAQTAGEVAEQMMSNIPNPGK